MERSNSFSSDQIILTKRQASMIMASMLLFCLFVFIVGFFLGKRMTIEDFSSQITKESLDDQINFLLTTQSLQSSEDDINLLADFKTNNNLEILPAKSLDTISHGILHEDSKQKSQKNSYQTPNNIEEKIVSENKINNHPSHKNPQYAQLIGFGTKKAAILFINRLKKQNIDVILKTMSSKTALGKQRIWYQAITPTYSTDEELQDQLKKIKKLEHIRDKDIKIMYMK
jgi:hypothetical protein